MNDGDLRILRRGRRRRRGIGLIQFITVGRFVINPVAVLLLKSKCRVCVKRREGSRTHDTLGFPGCVYFIGGFGVMGWVSAEDYGAAMHSNGRSSSFQRPMNTPRWRERKHPAVLAANEVSRVVTAG
jgi:hypothetical protein